MSTSRVFKYRNLVVIYILYIIFWIILTVILKAVVFPKDASIALTRFVPIDDALTEIGLIFVIFLPISGIIGTLLGGYILSPIIMAFHKFFYRTRKNYGIQYESKEKKIKLLSSGFYPVLLAVNFSFIFLTTEIPSAILEPNLVSEFSNVLQVQVLIHLLEQFVLLIFTFGASTILFSPVWVLKDSGIVFTSKEKVEKSNEPLLIKSIGEWFQTLLKGYAGIGVLFTYVFVIYDFFVTFITHLGKPGNILNIPSLILWLGLPFYLIFSMIPAVILHDALKKPRLSYVRKIANKIGIRDTAIVSFELRKDDKRY